MRYCKYRESLALATAHGTTNFRIANIALRNVKQDIDAGGLYLDKIFGISQHPKDVLGRERSHKGGDC